MEKKSIQQALTQIDSVIGSATNLYPMSSFTKRPSDPTLRTSPACGHITSATRVMNHVFPSLTSPSDKPQLVPFDFGGNDGQILTQPGVCIKFEAHSFLFFDLWKDEFFDVASTFFSLRGWIPHETISCIMFDNPKHSSHHLLVKPETPGRFKKSAREAMAHGWFTITWLNYWNFVFFVHMLLYLRVKSTKHI